MFDFGRVRSDRAKYFTLVRVGLDIGGSNPADDIFFYPVFISGNTFYMGLKILVKLDLSTTNVDCKLLSPAFVLRLVFSRFKSISLQGVNCIKFINQ